ncbi:MAG: 16S rRNA (cytosine(1402)-N(4))-methyltransferase RsmH [Aquabacterium sp.]|uniref:16S rRNA (cytosine(1402)-N(4))-methyltransferase RsmH n=1 Tax=Aquabacterium sp. TaxID=1872578 RepID=UPI0025C25B24|nr:16S rRNA (cytosine(1402)-N(4))-methyltransferase RsmH [Aquabacterium sp.]MBI5924264.1 16S rRNA (cytosine(1402)-N(4))-methyltransferase RsmH [Aquabacterium sp.]
MQEGVTPWQHQTVLLHEAVEGLWDPAVGPHPQGVYVDATFGRGGHSRLLLSKLGPQARLIALDRDPEAIAHATQGPNAINDPRFQIVHAPFSSWAEVVADLGLPGVHGLLMDIGVSSPQIDNPARGFSFRFDAPLDMRMDTTQGESAADYLAHASADEIAEVIRDYGEERFAWPIAKALVARRDEGHPVRTTAELSAVVARTVKTREAGQDPATRTFQALRIHVNRELGELEDALESALTTLLPGGRLSVISFHSLEDRIVKTFIAKHSREEVDRRVPFAQPKPLMLDAIARIKPSVGEVLGNPRSRSAVLRVAERTNVPWSEAPASGPVKGGKAKGSRSGGGKPGSKPVAKAGGKGGRR